MTSIQKSYWDHLEFEKEITQPIILNLNNNELIFQEGKRWTLAKSDIECAIEEIERLKSSLLKAEDDQSILKQEIDEINQTKAVVVEMLTEERQKNFQLEQEIFAYKNELRDSLKTILELKRSIVPS